MKARALGFALSSATLFAACIAADDADPELGSDPQESLLPVGGQRWPGGIVKYHLSSDFLSNANLMDAFYDMRTEYGTLTGLRFVEQNDTDQQTIMYVVGASPCKASSSLARPSGKPGSQITICPYGDRGTLVHETGHALGMAHEQSRPDRDNHMVCVPSCVDITFECTDPDLPLSSSNPDPTCIATRNACTQTGPANDFLKFTSSQVVAPYDLDSTMQYDSTWLSNGCSAVTKLNGGVITNKGDLSMEDINSLRAVYGVKIDGPDAGSEFGSVIATGDFDDDGYTDAAIAAPSAHEGTSVVGAVYLYKGTFGIHTVTASTSQQDWHTELVPWTMITPGTFGKSGQDGEDFGTALKAGDFNDDGITDLAIGAPGRNSEKGAVYVLHGKRYVQPTGITPLPALHDGLEPATNSYLTLENLGAATTANAGDHFGKAFGLGDLDGDGMSELLIGVPGRGTGKVVLLHHVSSATAMTYWKTLSPSSGLTGDQFGIDISAVDWDGDSKDDVAVGSPQDADAGSNGGGKLLLFLTTLNLAQFQTIGLTSPQLHDAFGAELAAGEYFVPGVKQLAVGSPGRSGSGRILVFGWDGSKLALLQTVSQSTIGASNNSGDRFGAHMRAAKLHGDVYADLVVGVPRKNPSSTTDAGRYYILHGGTLLFLTASTHEQPGFPIAGALFGEGVGSGDFDNDGAPDLLVGAPGYGSTGFSFSFEGASSGMTGEWFFQTPSFEDILP